MWNWRIGAGVFAPPGVSDKDRLAMVELMRTMAASKAWQDTCVQRDWTPITLLGDEYKAFIASESTRIEAILKDLGLS